MILIPSRRKHVYDRLLALQSVTWLVGYITNSFDANTMSATASVGLIAALPLVNSVRLSLLLLYPREPIVTQASTKFAALVHFF